jgi:hypothetical protein
VVSVKNDIQVEIQSKTLMDVKLSGIVLQLRCIEALLDGHKKIFSIFSWSNGSERSLRTKVALSARRL